MSIVNNQQDPVQTHLESKIILKQALMLNETAARFQGGDFGDVPISFFWMTSLPGRGPDLHMHPYAETFIMQHG